MQNKTATAPRFQWLIGLAVGLVASVISLTRIYTPLRSRSELVWAEDGAFPLCLLDSPALICIFEPYAGYLNFLPRVLALSTAFFPLDLWPISTNLTAALAWGAGSAFVYLWLVRNKVNLVAAIFSGISMVILPVLLVEVVNSVGSSWVVLLVCGALVVSFPPKGKTELWAACIVLFLSGLTSPISFFLFIPLIYWIVTRILKKKVAMTIVLTLVGSLFIQGLVVLNSSNSRIQEVFQQSITAWLRAWVTTLASLGSNLNWIYCEGLGYASWTDDCSIGSLPTILLTTLGVVFVVIFLVVGILCVKSGSSLIKSTGWLLLLSVSLSLFPTLFSGPNTRYYAAPLILICISIIIFVFHFVYWPLIVSSSVFVMILLSWEENFFASDFRTDSGSGWSNELRSLQARCSKEALDAQVEIRFTPTYWRATFEPPRRQVISCELVRKHFSGE